jgi:short-subunit dehydrogenase
MTPTQYRTSLVVGAGTGLSASIARRLARSGLRVALAARHTG